VRDGRRDVEVFASRDRELGRHAAGLRTWTCRGMEVWRCVAGVGTCRRYRGLELWSCAGGVYTWRCRGMEIWGSGGLLWAWGRRGMEICSSGGMLRVWGRFLKRGLEVRCRRVASICLKRPGTLEAHCQRRDVGVFASSDRELGRCAVGVQTWRYGDSEVWRRYRYV